MPEGDEETPLSRGFPRTAPIRIYLQQYFKTKHLSMTGAALQFRLIARKQKAFQNYSRRIVNTTREMRVALGMKETPEQAWRHAIDIDDIGKYLRPQLTFNSAAQQKNYLPVLPEPSRKRGGSRLASARLPKYAYTAGAPTLYLDIDKEDQPIKKEAQEDEPEEEPKWTHTEGPRGIRTRKKTPRTLAIKMNSAEGTKTITRVINMHRPAAQPQEEQQDLLVNWNSEEEAEFQVYEEATAATSDQTVDSTVEGPTTTLPGDMLEQIKIEPETTGESDTAVEPNTVNTLEILTWQEEDIFDSRKVSRRIAHKTPEEKKKEKEEEKASRNRKKKQEQQGASKAKEQQQGQDPARPPMEEQKGEPEKPRKDVPVEPEQSPGKGEPSKKPEDQHQQGQEQPRPPVEEQESEPDKPQEELVDTAKATKEEEQAEEAQRKESRKRRQGEEFIKQVQIMPHNQQGQKAVVAQESPKESMAETLVEGTFISTFKAWSDREKRDRHRERVEKATEAAPTGVTTMTTTTASSLNSEKLAQVQKQYTQFNFSSTAQQNIRNWAGGATATATAPAVTATATSTTPSMVQTPQTSPDYAAAALYLSQLGSTSLRPTEEKKTHKELMAQLAPIVTPQNTKKACKMQKQQEANKQRYYNMLASNKNQQQHMQAPHNAHQQQHMQATHNAHQQQQVQATHIVHQQQQLQAVQNAQQQQMPQGQHAHQQQQRQQQPQYAQQHQNMGPLQNAEDPNTLRPFASFEAMSMTSYEPGARLYRMNMRMQDALVETMGEDGRRVQVLNESELTQLMYKQVHPVVADASVKGLFHYNTESRPRSRYNYY